MHREWQAFPLREGGYGLVQRGTDCVRSVRRDSEPQLWRGQTVQLLHGRLELEHARFTLRGIGAEDLLVHDPPSGQVVQRAHHRSRAACFRDTCDTARPAVAHSRNRSLVERCSGRCVLELSNTADPLDELGLVVLDTTTQPCQLEMRVTIDETRHQHVIWKFKRFTIGGNGDTRMVVHRSNPPARIHENGAVLDGRRRDGMHPTSSDPEHAFWGGHPRQTACAPGQPWWTPWPA